MHLPGGVACREQLAVPQQPWHSPVGSLSVGGRPMRKPATNIQEPLFNPHTSFP